MKYLEKTKERILKNASFLKWNKNNNLNPYLHTENDIIVFGFHGTFTTDQAIATINPNASNKEYVHGVGGLYLSSNHEDVNQFYLDPELEGSDFQANIYESMEKAQNMFRRINLKAMNENEYIDFEETYDFLEYVFNHKKADEFFNIFGFKKNEFDFEKIKKNQDDEFYRFAKRVQMKTQGVMLPCVIKMEKPAYIIKPEIAEKKGLKSTSLFYISDGSGENIDDRTKKTEDVLDLVCQHFNLNKIDIINNFYCDEPNIDGYHLFTNISATLRIINTDIEDDMDVELEDYIQNLVSEHGYCEDEMYFLGSEEEIKQAKIEAEQYDELMVILSDESIIDDYCYDVITKAINRQLEKNSYEYSFSIYSLLNDLKNEGEIEAELILKNDVLPKLYDGFVYHANSEFKYISNNFSEDIFHYVLCKSRNLKYIYNQSFSNEETLMHKRVEQNQGGIHLPIDKINKIIEQFQNKYDVTSKITVSDYNAKSAATFDKENKAITIYKNHVKSQDDLMRILFHEVIIHEGMAQFMETEDKSFFLNIYREYKGDPAFKHISKLYPEYDLNTLNGKLKITEEFLAHTAEDQLLFKSKGLNKFIYMLKKIINKICEKLNINIKESKLFLNIDEMEKNKHKTKNRFGKI